jgi:hypothetical protein
METFWRLFRQSVIVTALMALLVLVGLVVMLCLKISVPKEYWVVVFSVIGFFFGAKAGASSAVL